MNVRGVVPVDFVAARTHVRLCAGGAQRVRVPTATIRENSSAGSLCGLSFGARPNWALGANRKTLSPIFHADTISNSLAFVLPVVQLNQPIPSAQLSFRRQVVFRQRIPRNFRCVLISSTF
jgi:hypothetical protein